MIKSTFFILVTIAKSQMTAMSVLANCTIWRERHHMSASFFVLLGTGVFSYLWFVPRCVFTQTFVSSTPATNRGKIEKSPALFVRRVTEHSLSILSQVSDIVQLVLATTLMADCCWPQQDSVRGAISSLSCYTKPTGRDVEFCCPVFLSTADFYK